MTGMHTAEPAYFQVMVSISSTSDFPNWCSPRKLTRYERALEWHDYIRGLQQSGHVTHTWGARQVLGRSYFLHSHDLVIAVYRVRSWSEFDDLLVADPLRDVSEYSITRLFSLLSARDEDTLGYQAHNVTFSLSQPDEHGNIGELRYAGERIEPPNRATEISATSLPGQNQQFLVVNVSPPEYGVTLDDAGRLAWLERVTLWYDFVALMIQQGKISHGWGTRDFSFPGAASHGRCGPIIIFSATSFEAFYETYQLNPMRDITFPCAVLLRSASHQRRLDEARLKIARNRESVGRSVPSASPNTSLGQLGIENLRNLGAV